MSLGTGIFLIVVGAIIRWALPGLWEVPGVDWTMIGTILLVAGIVVSIFGIIQFFRAGRRKSVTRSEVDPRTGARIDTNESDNY